jgi:hypothetical protein
MIWKIVLYMVFARLYHHANFQQNRSTIERFINNFIFSTPEEKNRDESGAELVRDGPMVSLAKMMLMDSSITMLNMENAARLFNLFALNPDKRMCRSYMAFVIELTKSQEYTRNHKK